MTARYVSFQAQHAVAPLLNIGCGINPCGWRGSGYVHFDIDLWDYPNFVQGDAHSLPFSANSFASAVLGDMLEHVINPAQVLREAGRVAPKVVMTTFQEWRLGHSGKDIEAGRKLYMPEGVELDCPKGLIKRTSEEVTSHHPHIWQWTPDLLAHVIRSAGLKIVIEESDCPGTYAKGTQESHEMLNYLFVLERSNA